MTKKPYWFKRHRYGWGWVPASWQGGLTLAVYVAAVVGSALLLLDNIDNDPFSSDVLVFVAIFYVSTLLLLTITSKTGPEPKWRWGSKPDDKPDEDW